MFVLKQYTYKIILVIRYKQFFLFFIALKQIYIAMRSSIQINIQNQTDQNDSIRSLQKRVMEFETKQNNKIIDELKDLLRNQKQTIRSELMMNQRVNTEWAKSITKTSCQTTEQELYTDDKLYIEQLKHHIEQLQNYIEQVEESFNQKLEENNQKLLEKNEFFLQLIHQIHENHNHEILYYKNIIMEYEEDKRQMGNIETKMNHIGIGVQEILKESEQLAKINQKLSHEIVTQTQEMQILKKELLDKNQEIRQYQLRLDEFQKLKLKTSRYSKDIMDMIEQTEKIVTTTLRSESRQIRESICPVTKLNSKFCNHCKLYNLRLKYENMDNQ